MNWIEEKGKEYTELEHFDKNVYGFIYIIKHKKTGRFYIGKKQLLSVVNKKLGKKELIAIKEDRKVNKVQGKQPTKKRVISENGWQDYWGSCKPLLQEIKEQGKDKFERQILQLCYNSKQLTYFEVMYQFKYDVLQNNNCYNETILGRYHRKDFK